MNCDAISAQLPPDDEIIHDEVLLSSSPIEVASQPSLTGRSVTSVTNLIEHSHQQMNEQSRPFLESANSSVNSSANDHIDSPPFQFDSSRIQFDSTEGFYSRFVFIRAQI